MFVTGNFCVIVQVIVETSVFSRRVVNVSYYDYNNKECAVSGLRVVGKRVDLGEVFLSFDLTTQSLVCPRRAS